MEEDPLPTEHRVSTGSESTAKWMFKNLAVSHPSGPRYLYTLGLMGFKATFEGSLIFPKLFNYVH